MSIKSYKDLEVFQNTYKTSLLVLTKLIPLLPKEEKYDLADQLRRSSKTIPRLIAEGYAKKHYKNSFKKYLDDAMGECNEMVVSLSHCRDVYYKYIDTKFCDKLIDIYDKSGRQLYNLGKAWRNFDRELG